MKDTLATLFEDREKVNQGWNLFARILLISASVGMMVFLLTKYRCGFASYSAHIFVFYIGNDELKYWKMLAPNRNRFLGFDVSSLSGESK